MSDRGDVLFHSDRTEDAANLVIDAHGSRQRIQRRLTLENVHQVAARPEHQRERLSHRAEADDRNVDKFPLRLHRNSGIALQLPRHHHAAVRENRCCRSLRNTIICLIRWITAKEFNYTGLTNSQ